MRKTVVVAAKRTAIGSFGGVFKNVSAVELGVKTAKNIFEETKVSPELVDEVIIGNVIGAGLGQNVARQICLGAGVPNTTPAYTVNKVCGSGMKTIALADMMIKAGEADVILCGGTENMSQIPYILPNERWGARMGDKKVVDIMVNDGLWDVFNNYHMGVTAENLAEKFDISKSEQDAFAASSQQKTEKAMNENKFKDEIVPITIPQRRGDDLVIDTDEFPKAGVTAEKIGKLKPCFKKDGTVTAASSSGINDGAALLLLMSEEKANELGLEILAELVGASSGGVDPSIMGYGPVPAIKKLLQKTGWSIGEIELAELNEAFASQSLAVLKGLEQDGFSINPEIVNVNGGAISLGHPIGASGARIVVTLLHEMKKRQNKKGLAALCIGGGMGIATLFSR